MANKRSLKNYALAVLRELLAPSEETAAAPPVEGMTLEDLRLDDLRREKIRLEQEERKMLARLREVEARKRQLFEEGVRNASEREQRVFARRIKELDVRANNMDSMLQVISKQMRILNGLIQVKERARVMAESGISKLLADIDLQDLIIYIDKASVDGEFHMSKFDELLGILEEADSISPAIREDDDVNEIVRLMQEAQEAADDPAQLDKKFEELQHLSGKEKERSTDEFEGFEEEF